MSDTTTPSASVRAVRAAKRPFIDACESIEKSACEENRRCLVTATKNLKDAINALQAAPEAQEPAVAQVIKESLIMLGRGSDLLDNYVDGGYNITPHPTQDTVAGEAGAEADPQAPGGSETATANDNDAAAADEISTRRDVIRHAKETSTDAGRARLKLEVDRVIESHFLSV